jgi:hypothetical protein
MKIYSEGKKKMSDIMGIFKKEQAGARKLPRKPCPRLPLTSEIKRKNANKEKLTRLNHPLAGKEKNLPKADTQSEFQKEYCRPLRASS